MFPEKPTILSPLSSNAPSHSQLHIHRQKGHHSRLGPVGSFSQPKGVRVHASGWTHTIAMVVRVHILLSCVPCLPPPWAPWHRPSTRVIPNCTFTWEKIKETNTVVKTSVTDGTTRIKMNGDLRNGDIPNPPGHISIQQNGWMIQGGHTWNPASWTKLGGISNLRREHPSKAMYLGGLLRWHGYDPNKTDYLVKGFTEGFHLWLDASVQCIADDIRETPLWAKSNQKSARVNPVAVETKLRKELQAEKYDSPFLLPSFQGLSGVALGLLREKITCKFRIIHNLSAPFGGPSVNSHIPTKAGSVSYDTVDTAIWLIQAIGPGVVLAKTDIEHAYKLIPIHSAGIKWFEDWLWDCTLTMGSRSGCAIFKTFSHAVQFLSESRGCGDISHMLDDFLMDSPDNHISDERLSRFHALFKLLGIPVVWEKTESGICIIFLGITLDTVKMEARLPQDKLDKCLRLVNSYRQLQKISIKQLESLNGLLNFACKVVHPGMPFLRRLYCLMEGFRRRLPFFKIRLTAGAKEDLRMWDLFSPAVQWFDHVLAHHHLYSERLIHTVHVK